MAENDNNAPAGGINNDPLKMRNTETSALKRIPVSPNSASASSAARKTIKLKPLMPSSSAGRPVSPAAPNSPEAPQGTAPKAVEPPSFLLNRKPAAPAAEEPPKFMSSNTAPISKMAAPNPQKPIMPTELNAESMPTKTVSIPRLQAKKIPSSVSAAPKPYASTATAPITAEAQPPPQKPLAAAALGSQPVPSPVVTPAAETVIEPTPAPAGSTITQGIQKQTVEQAKMPSGLQSAKPAIKLRPSNAPTQSEAVLSTQSPTIKLMPQTSSAVTPVPPAAAQAAAPVAPATINLTPKTADAPGRKPSPTINLTPKTADVPGRKPSPTINLTPKTPSAARNPESAATVTDVNAAEASAGGAASVKDVTVTTKIPRSKPRLKPVMPGAAANLDEAKLREQGDIANQKMEQLSVEDEQTIKQEATGERERKGAPQGKNKAQTKTKGKTSSSEPHIIFAISAILAFLVIGYTVFALTAQYLTLWEQKNIPVVGFQQLDEQLSKK